MPFAEQTAPPSRREQILAAAAELFARHGFHGVGINDIGAAVGISGLALYRHFRSKEGAYIACVERARDDYQRRLIESVDLSSPPREQLAAGSRAFFEMIEEDPGRWRLLFGSNAVLPGEYDQRLAEEKWRHHAGPRQSVPGEQECTQQQRVPRPHRTRPDRINSDISFRLAHAPP